MERDLEQERQETTQLRETLHQKETQLQSLHGIEQELNAEYDKLRSTHDMLRDELERERDEGVKKERVAQSQMHQQKLAFQDEKDHLQQRIKELEENVERLHAEAKKRDKQFLKVSLFIKEELCSLNQIVVESLFYLLLLGVNRLCK